MNNVVRQNPWRCRDESRYLDEPCTREGGERAHTFPAAS
jgi:hypothetical protein